MRRARTGRMPTAGDFAAELQRLDVARVRVREHLKREERYGVAFDHGRITIADYRRLYEAPLNALVRRELDRERRIASMIRSAAPRGSLYPTVIANGLILIEPSAIDTHDDDSHFIRVPFSDVTDLDAEGRTR
jgi:hypothetical protein